MLNVFLIVTLNHLEYSKFSSFLKVLVFQLLLQIKKLQKGQLFNNARYKHLLIFQQLLEQKRPQYLNVQ
jgi:hypothetical protein